MWPGSPELHLTVDATEVAAAVVAVESPWSPSPSRFPEPLLIVTVVPAVHRAGTRRREAHRTRDRAARRANCEVRSVGLRRSRNTRYRQCRLSRQLGRDRGGCHRGCSRVVAVSLPWSPSPSRFQPLFHRDRSCTGCSCKDRGSCANRKPEPPAEPTVSSPP